MLSGITNPYLWSPAEVADPPLASRLGVHATLARVLGEQLDAGTGSDRAVDHGGPPRTAREQREPLGGDAVECLVGIPGVHRRVRDSRPGQGVCDVVGPVAGEPAPVGLAAVGVSELQHATSLDIHRHDGTGIPLARRSRRVLAVAACAVARPSRLSGRRADK